MNKNYTSQDSGSPAMAAEPAVAYAIPPRPVHLDVTIENNAEVITIQRALQMIKGIRSVRVASMSREAAVDPFAELDTAWGGSRDANDIADELHSMRQDSRIVEAW